VNAGKDKINSALNALPSSTTASAYAAAVAPYFAASEAVIPKLLAVHWAGQADTDVRSLVADMGAVDGDLSAFSTPYALNFSTVAQLAEDGSEQQIAVETVRADVGLRPRRGSARSRVDRTSVCVSFGPVNPQEP
jgi:hypothetical protein